MVVNGRAGSSEIFASGSVASTGSSLITTSTDAVSVSPCGSVTVTVAV